MHRKKERSSFTAMHIPTGKEMQQRLMPNPVHQVRSVNSVGSDRGSDVNTLLSSAVGRRKPSSREGREIQVNPVNMSQKMVMNEKFNMNMFDANGYWDSGAIELLDQQWSFRFSVNKGDVSRLDFRIKFEGPASRFELSQIVIALGPDNNLVEKLNGKSNTPAASTKNSYRSGKNAYSQDTSLRFITSEAKHVRNFVSVSRFKKLCSPTNKIYIAISFRTAYDMDAAKTVDIKKKESRTLRTELIRMTQQRNNLHKSLQNVMLSDNDVARIAGQFTTQPELSRQFDAFKTNSRQVVLLLFSPQGQNYLSILKKVALLIKDTVISAHVRQCEETFALFTSGNRNYPTIQPDTSNGNAFSPLRKQRSHGTARGRAVPLPPHLEGLEDVWKQLVRATTPKELDEVARNRGEEGIVNNLVTRIKTEAAEQDIDLEHCVDGLNIFGKFVWGFERYRLGNPDVQVPWELIGQKVEFNRDQWKSISGRMKAGQPCIICVPPLQQENHTTMSHGLVYPMM